MVIVKVSIRGNTTPETVARKIYENLVGIDSQLASETMIDASSPSFRCGGFSEEELKYSAYVEVHSDDPQHALTVAEACHRVTGIEYVQLNFVVDFFKSDARVNTASGS